jgi:DNA-binding PadR family transcriptional regulator
MIRLVSSNLSPVSYLILGLVSRGATTPYALKQEVAKSVGYFWPFPHSQFYSEPARLVALGLLDEVRENEGRRRRQFTITAAGRAALAAWVREPTGEQPQIRDTGLLKLFFAERLSREEVVALARAQETAHRERLATYEEIDRRLSGAEPHPSFSHATLKMGLLCEGAFVDFWSAIAANPPQAALADVRSLSRAAPADAR